MSSEHKPVLLDECLCALSIKPGGIYIDGTFGRGGHSQAILNVLGEDGRLIAIDKDSDAVAFAKERFQEESRFSIYHGSFDEVADFAKDANIFGKVDGILLDLGVSSPQLDNPDRGFSFIKDGPLDMRMDTTQGQSASEWINQADEADISTVLKEYGEERFARRIAKAICEYRQKTPFKRTLELAEVVAKANPKWEKHKHPATRAFQAIRIFINRELDSLERFLNNALELLAPGGRLAIISFHSLEDRMVKLFMRKQAKCEVLPRKLPIRDLEMKNKMFKLIGKAIKPSDSEVSGNVRARSAVLRVGEKLA